jgi:uncharacterized protein YecT (DUF1311 family)
MLNRSALGLMAAIHLSGLRMRALNAAVLICALSLSFFAGQARAVVVQDERTVREQCSMSSFSQVDMRECLEKRSQASEVALKRAEVKALRAITRWDEDATYITEARVKLKASGREFLKYRNAHCAFLASLTGGGAGNSHEMARLACVFELNTRRAKQLKSVSDNLPPK